MTTYQRPGSPFWWATIPDPGAPGGRRRVSTKVPVGPRPKVSQKEADRAAAEQAAKIAARYDPNARREVTLADALQAHIDALRGDGKPHWRGYARSRDKMLGLLPSSAGKFRLDGSRPVSTLTPADVRALKSARAAEGNLPGTTAHELRLLRAACNRARHDGATAPKIERWEVPMAGKRQRYLTVEEAQALLAYLSPDRPVTAGKFRKEVVPGGLQREERQDVYDLTLFYLSTGARADEAHGLTRGAVDLQRRVVTIRGKGNKVREVPIPNVAHDMLKRRLARPGSAYVFPGDGGHKRAGPCRAITRAMDATGLNPPEIVSELGAVSVHSLRHTFASWARLRGVALDDLQRLLGHATIAQTQAYAHIMPQDAADRVAVAMRDVLAA